MSPLSVFVALLIGCDDAAEEPIQQVDTPAPTGDTGTADDAEPEPEEEPEPEPEPEEEPEDGVSEDDAYAQAACTGLKEDSQELVLAASESEAAQLTVLPDGAPLQLVMPESGDGWMVVEVPDWMTRMRVFSDEDVSYEILGSDAEVLTERLTNGACPDAAMTDQRYGFHAWGAYAVRFSEGPERVWFVALIED